MTDCADKLAVLLRGLKLPSFSGQHEEGLS